MNLQSLRRNYLLLISPQYQIFHRYIETAITSSDEAKRQSELFCLESKRQKAKIGRIEKITVSYEGLPENTTLVMNKDLSTPYDCAKRGMIANRSALALVNGEAWHIHKPLQDSCNLQFLHYNVPQPASANKAFWRTCSFILGAVINNAFKDSFKVHLHSFPSPNVRSGSFIYDAQIELENWTPTESELRVLSAEMVKFCLQNYQIHCLDVSVECALSIFKNNEHKTKQIPNIAASNRGKVTLFKAGDHIDISKGPMITNTNHLGRITIANVFKLNTDIPGGPVYRFQGVALPRSIILNHFAYSIIEERAKKLVGNNKIQSSYYAIQVTAANPLQSSSGGNSDYFLPDRVQLIGGSGKNWARIPSVQGLSEEDNSFVRHSVA